MKSGGIPCSFESVETNVPAFVDVAMIYLCLETDLWRTERVGIRELNVESEYTTIIPSK
jgi:hypothetical protein